MSLTAPADPADAYLEALAAHAGIDARGVAPPASRRIRIDGRAFRYLDWGPADAPPIVLLHGGGQSAHTWDACCLQLARRHRCLALDQRGHGDSDWSAEGAYGFDDHARDIAGFVAGLQLRAPLLVGMSMGGINATAYATSHAQTLRGLVAVDVGPDVRFEAVERLMRGLGAYRFFASPKDAAVRLSGLGARRPRALLEATLAQNLRRADDARWTWKYDPQTLVERSAAEILDPRQALWARLAAITCPTLVVRGAQSEIFAPADAERFVRALPRGRFVTVPAARHTVQTDNPKGLVAAIEAFDAAL
jgi:pimeloyl-ACP methyl ester carboxylesterase